MEVFRLCTDRHSQLDGEGARLYGGRWNSRGRAVVYASVTLSLAVLEYLVHVDPDNLPVDLVSLKIEIPDGVSQETYGGSVAPPEPDAAPIGDEWIDRADSLLFLVPSAVVGETNVLINPRHAEMSQVRLVEKNPFVFDPRLSKR